MLNQDKMSKELRHFMQTKTGFRSDDQSELADVIGRKPSNLNILEDEMVERENPDIPETIDYLYNVQANTPEKVDQFVKQQLKTDSYQLIWLCDSRANSAEYADSNEPDHIYSVNLRNKTILPISDLDCEGFLIAYKQKGFF